MSDKESSSSNNSFEFNSNDNNNDDLNNILVTTPKVLHPTLSSISSDHHLNLLLQVTNSLYKSSLPLSCSHSYFLCLQHSTFPPLFLEQFYNLGIDYSMLRIIVI